MSHEHARAFGAIMTTMWPLGTSEQEGHLINLARLVTTPGGTDAVPADRLTGALDLVLVRGGSKVGMNARLISWRAACLVSGALTSVIEIRLDVLAEHLSGRP